MTVAYNHDLFTASLLNNNNIDSHDTARLDIETELAGIDFGLLCKIRKM